MRTSIGLFLLGYLVIMISFNNCSAVHQGDASLSSFEACNLILKDEFSNGYHTFLKNNCASCHTNSGTGNGAFADDGLDSAFDAFLVRGNVLVGDRALDPNHQPPYSGAQHTDEISSLDTTWDAAKVQADACVAAAGGNQDNDIPEGIVPSDPQPTEGTVQTYVKLLSAGQDARTITWDLGTEIRTPGFDFPNAQLSIDVIANTTITGEKSYIFLNPKLTAGDVSLHIIFIEFIINNSLVEGATSYHSINRRVPSGQERDLAVGSTTFGYNVQATDTVALSIGVLEQIAFNPPTFAELIAPGGVFGANCLSCHDTATARGGFDISSRDTVLQQLMVAPYSPNNSEVFLRMNDEQRPMPQAGLLPQASIDQVLQWIQDGAP